LRFWRSPISPSRAASSRGSRSATVRARGVEAASAALGVESVGETLRRRFAAAIGDDGA